MELISQITIPAVLCVCGIMLLVSKKNLFSAFLSGAEKGARTAAGLLPGLVIMCTAAAMFNASGAAATLSQLILPVTDLLKIPSEIVPFLVVRPISGSASNSIISELFGTVGADSLAGIAASVIAGSSDTLIYIISVYFSAVKVKNTRHALPAGIISMIFVIILGCAVARIII